MSVSRMSKAERKLFEENAVQNLNQALLDLQDLGWDVSYIHRLVNVEDLRNHPSEFDDVIVKRFKEYAKVLMAMGYELDTLIDLIT